MNVKNLLSLSHVQKSRPSKSATIRSRSACKFPYKVHVIRSHANRCVYKENEKLVEREEEEATVDWGKSVHLLSYKKKELLCI
ncbi:hypothetical protein T12_959 [Trichinella patagoniensis]|uniref:Uncharacterized protein n=1 Tax=Trichinella patagoniensis TaxID=990121 RepID=A0A0V0ZYT6_9BILA|nr:hypothetical protein T12_959 [Trichinella patagoniensis]